MSDKLRDIWEDHSLIIIPTALLIVVTVLALLYVSYAYDQRVQQCVAAFPDLTRAQCEFLSGLRR